MATIDDFTDLDTYRSPRTVLQRGATVTEIAPETIFVNPDGTAERPGRANPNVPAGGSAEARAFRGVPGPAANDIGATTRVLTRAQRLAQAARGVVAGAAPVVAGAALARTADATLAANRTAPGDIGVTPPGMVPIPNDPARNPVAPAAVDPSFFRDTDVGRNVGNAVNALAGGGPIGAVRTLAEGMRAGSRAGRVADIASNVSRGAVVAGGGAGAAAAPAAASTQLPVVGAGAGRGFVNPAGVDPRAAALEAPETGAVPAADVGGGVVFPQASGEAVGRELRALAIERENSALRQALDAYGPGARNPDGSGGAASLSGDYGTRLAQLNRETTADSRRFDARLAGGARGRDLLESADRIEAAGEPGAERRNRMDIATLNASTERTARAATDRTTQRGQDLQLQGERERGGNALAIESMRGRSARDVAALTSDSRVAAAGAKGMRPVVVDMGEEMVETPAGPQKVKRPSLVIDADTGQVIDLAAAGGTARAPAKPAGGIANDPRAIAIRDNPKLTLAEKREQLKALGYQ